MSTPGRLGAARVRPGDRVRRGDVLLELESFAHEDHLARLKTSRDVQRVELSIQQVLENRPGIRIAEESLRGLEEQVRDAEEQAARLTVVAPCDGLVVVAADSGTNGQEPAEGLPSRRGTPLDHRNLGAWLDAGTHVLSIAPDSRFEAQVFIEQGTRDDVSDGEAVAVKLDHLPQRTSAGALGKIDDRHVEFVPQAVSNKFGGSLATRTVSDGRERLAESAFQSTLPLDDDPELMRSGLRGAARFTIGRRTAGDWLWRSVCETFHFRL